MKAFFRFMANNWGRLLRIVLGAALIIIGLTQPDETNVILVLVGVVPLAAGLFDFCVFAPLLGYPFSGKKLRQSIAAH